MKRRNIVTSNCAQYVATLHQSSLLLEVATIADTNSRLVAFDLAHLVSQHLQNNVSAAAEATTGGTRASSARTSAYARDAVVSQLQWEKVLPGATSTKLGVVVESSRYSFVMILELHPSSISPNPIVIHQSVVEGIQSFEWIAPVEGQDEQHGSAYTNSKQLVVFTKNNLVARAYSLDYTHLLFEVAKPVHPQILVRPSPAGGGPAVWSIVAASAHSHFPTIFHFHNEGPTSRLLCKFQIQSLEGQDVSWSKSGKWLTVFDCVNQLYGFKLQVYTSLGIFKRLPSGSSRSVFKGDPIIDIDWLTDINPAWPDAADLELGCLDYRAEPITLSDGEDYILAMGTELASGSASPIRLLIVSMKDLKVTRASEFVLQEQVLAWSVRGGDRYVRTSKRRALVSLGTSLQSIRTSSLQNRFVLVYERALLVCTLQATDVTVEAVIELSSALKSIEFVESDSLLLVATEEEASVYSCAHRDIHVISRAVMGEIVGVDYIGDMAAIVATSDDSWTIVDDISSSREDDTSERAARTVSIERAERAAAAAAAAASEPLESSPPKSRVPQAPGTTQRANYLASLVERAEARGPRLKRGRLSLANDSRDEITDTFNLRGGPKRRIPDRFT